LCDGPAEVTAVPYQLRDQSGASRSVAYLMLAAAPFIFVTGVVLPTDRSVPGVLAIAALCAGLATGGWAARWRAERVPKPLWLFAPFLGVLLITLLNVTTHDDSTGAQLFYLWPVLYSSNFLSRRLIYLTLAAVSAGHATTVFPLNPPGAALADWVSLTTALSLTGIVVATLRNRNERLRDVLETQAFADPLTGVANRRSFDGELARAVAWSHRTGQPIALLTIDIDHFKKINDTYGHGVGDQALQVVAAALGKVAHGEDDMVGRLGGDEFVVLLRVARPDARRAADDIRETVATITTLPGGPPGLSIGVALMPDHAGSAEELVTASDRALYEAKAGGRGRTAVAHPPGPRQNVDQLPADTPAPYRFSDAG
jgi:diguanylate cyclase (GGDEF)-like protein